MGAMERERVLRCCGGSLKRRDHMAKQSTKAAAPASKPASSTGKKAGGGLATPVQPSPELAVIVGKDALPRAEIVKKMWDYIKKHDLQNPANKREILADEKLK